MRDIAGSAEWSSQLENNCPHPAQNDETHYRLPDFLTRLEQRFEETVDPMKKAAEHP